MEILVLVLVFLLGMVVGVLSVYLRYRAKTVGDIVVYKDEGKTRFMLELETDPEEIETAKAVRFRIVPPNVDSSSQ